MPYYFTGTEEQLFERGFKWESIDEMGYYGFYMRDFEAENSSFGITPDSPIMHDEVLCDSALKLFGDMLLAGLIEWREEK